MNHQKVYDSIIKNARNENRIRKSWKQRKKENTLDGYYEEHHIIPRCIKIDESEENKVLLTAREHFICHKLLTYIYPHNRAIVNALFRMTYCKNGRYIISSRDYAYIKELRSKTPISEETRNKMKNKVISEETCKKISKTRKERECGVGEKNSMFGKSVYSVWIEKFGKEIADKKLKEFKEKDRISNSGENAAMYGKTFYDIWVEKLGKKEADIKMQDFLIKNKDRNLGEKNPMFGKKHKLESIEKNKKSQPYNSENFPQWLKDKIGEKSKGEKNAMFGKSFYDIWLIKYGKEIADKKLEDYKEKCKQKIYIYHVDLNRQVRINKNNLEKYMNLGWKIGKLNE